MTDFSYEDFLDLKKTGDKDLLKEFSNHPNYATYQNRYKETVQAKISQQPKVQLTREQEEALAVKGFEKVGQKVEIAENRGNTVQLSNKSHDEQMLDELSTKFKDGKTQVDIVQLQSGVEKAKRILNDTTSTQNQKLSAQGFINKANEKMRQIGAQNAQIGNRETDLQFSIAQRNSRVSVAAITGEHDRRRKTTYQKAPARPAQLKDIKFSTFAATQQIVQQAARQVNLKMIISTEYLKGDLDNLKLKREGHPHIWEKAARVIKHHRAMYQSYLDSLEAILQNPNIAPKERTPRITAHFNGADKKLVQATVQPTWKYGLSDKTIKIKQEKGFVLTAWKHTGRLAADYAQSKRKHVSSLKGSDFYDKTKLNQTMTAMKAETDAAGLGNPRRASVTVSLDLLVPYWNGRHGEVMDDLITKPYIHVWSGANRRNYKTHEPMSKHLKVRKGAYERMMNDEAEEGVRKDFRRVNANAVIRETGTVHRRRLEAGRDLDLAHAEYRLKRKGMSKAEIEKNLSEYKARLDKAIENRLAYAKEQAELEDQHQGKLTVGRVRNLAYELRRYNSGYDRGVRRFLNPEIRRPFVAALSLEAGKQSRLAITGLAEKAYS